MSNSRNFTYLTVADFVVRSAYQIGKTPLLPIFAAALGATGAFLGFIVSVSTLTGMVLKPFVGIFSDRWGRRVWLIAGTTFFAVIPFFYRWVDSPEALFTIRIIHGISTAIYGPVTLAYITEQSKRRRAERLGVFSMARSAGYIVGPAAAGWLLLTMDPVGVFTIIGFLSCLAFVPILLLPESSEQEMAQEPVPLKTQVVDALRSGGRTPAVWLSGGLEATMYVALYAARAFLPIYALSIGVNVALVGGFFSLQEATHLVLKPWGGRLGDRMGYRSTIGWGVILLGVTLPLLTIAPNGWWLLIPAMLMGIVQAIVFPSTIALVSAEVSAQNLGAGMGIIGTLQNAGKVAGPIIGGFLITWFDFALTFRLMGVALLIGTALVWLRFTMTQKVHNEKAEVSVGS